MCQGANSLCSLVISNVVSCCVFPVFPSVPCKVKHKLVYSDHIKQRILFYRQPGKSLQQIVCSLEEEGQSATKADMTKFLRCYEAVTIAHAPGRGQKSKMTAETGVANPAFYH